MMIIMMLMTSQFDKLSLQSLIREMWGVVCHHHHTNNSAEDDDDGDNDDKEENVDDDDFTMELSVQPCKGGGGESKSSHSRRQIERHCYHKYSTNTIQIQYKCFTNTELIQYKYGTFPQADRDTGSGLFMNSPLTRRFPLHQT